MELHAQIACAMPRELARKGIGWQDRAVYTEGIYYGRENLTDGVITRGELGYWMPDMPIRERTRRLNALRDAGALLDHPAGWQYPEHVWRKWGKLRSEVEAKREAEAERVRAYRERQRSERTTNADRTRVRDEDVRGAYKTPEPEPEPEPKPEPKPSPVTSADGFENVVALIVDGRTRHAKPTRPDRYRPAVDADVRTTLGPTIAQALADNPDADPTLIAIDLDRRAL